MVAGQEAGEILWEMVRSLENSYDLDRMTPGHLYRKDCRSVFNTQEQLEIGATTFKVFGLKMAVEHISITPRTVGALMFYAGYARIMQPSKRDEVNIQEFLTLKVLDEGLEVLGTEFHEHLLITIDRMISDGRMKTHSPEGFGVWCWALGQRYGEYQDAMDDIERAIPT